jgi:hypothetical protein
MFVSKLSMAKPAMAVSADAGGTKAPSRVHVHPAMGQNPTAQE